ncbi:polysaccharide deacetylase family protein [Massilia glaciei]|uniref:Polysaccharide deacetylase n=1 Tax=Massilia glaciei TaxID=1524097 RepID=A0A2U2HIR4_9BURK|nr:polysaccharide deacetylase family protein [Massilia glaciei]PWF46685.1 polysaccharide deacetylase [Massilia glaciei]
MKPLLTLIGALVFAACAPAAQAQSVAFTFDDGPKLGPTPRLTPRQRNDALLAALAKHRVKAALFVTAANGADVPAGYALAKAWGEAGHALGNHTMTHPDLNDPKLSLAQYQQEILDCDKIIGTLPGYQKWYRYTFLREGNTPARRDAMRAFLRGHGYRNAFVSIDTSDWRLDDALTELLTKNPEADLAPLKRVYLAHIRQRALAYRAMSQQLQGRDMRHVLLLHHNLINALWLGDVIAQFRDMGWSIISPAEALADPVYQLAPLRAGQSLLLSMAKSLGTSNFPDWERLHDDGDAEILALAAAPE